MDSTNDYFSRLLPQLADRARSAVLGRLGFSHLPLYRHLHGLFSRPFGEPGCFLADPTFEAAFGWQEGDKSMADLVGGPLTERLVEAMDNPPDRDDERCPERDPQKRKEQHPYRFGRDRKPYRHQLEAWEILAREQPQSLIVASGTGSGKTECFMVPILDRLIRQQQECGSRLIGVRALFLYPLNALINSQRERLRAWTGFSEGDIRFSLYNGNTPEETKAENKKRFPSEVLDRKTLRESSPPILVTNATMLEYMLVRSVDAPILDQSQGKLEWVVLDEAHTYVGSQAAELALLIRRVLHAFGVMPQQVRFVATSATIGDPEGEAGQRLKRFLAEVAGLGEERVHLVAGQRHIPALPSPAETGKEPPEFAAVANDPAARRIREQFVAKPGSAKVARLSEVCRLLQGGEGPYSREQQVSALGWLDRLSGARDVNGAPFLPLRAHLFHQTLSGIWACADPVCRFREDTALDDPAWPFGQVFLEPRQHCTCGSPVYELVVCDDCGEPHLLAVGRKGYLVQPSAPGALDEFELDADREDSGEDAEPDENGEEADGSSAETETLVVNRPDLPGTGFEIIQRQSRQYVDREVEGETLRLVLQNDAGDGLGCPCCGGKNRRGRRELFQKARVGAPFSLSFILPTLLEFAPDERCKPQELPYRGRRLLTFNDSRQGTARMAARLQQESERNRVRGLVYHLTLREGVQQASAEIEQLRKERKKLLPLLQNEAARGYAEERLRKIDADLEGRAKPKPIPFDNLVQHLSNSGEDFSRMLRHYQNDVSRDSFGGVQGPLALARMFLVREFGRRPKRLNNLETMGLVSVQYPALEQVVTPHQPFTLDEWHAFLKIALDFFVRAGGSLVIDEPTRHWLGIKLPRSWLVDRDRTELGRRQRRWPRATYALQKGGRQPNIHSTLVRLLAHVLKADIATSKGEDLVDAALAAAWQALTETSGILQADADGRCLPLSALALTPITNAWICPVTRRVLDTTLRGVTPYLPLRANEATAKCQAVSIPLYDQAFGGGVEPLAQIDKARHWLAKQAAIEELREQGIWSQLNDRTIELAPYFTSAEHSAQQPSDRLDRYERAFKNGELNLLSCSTTMEMGIDIGGIAMVAMNNVPPHPANYLQRAGRAGRRQEARSLAFTLCKSNPHDQIVFAKTDWPFVTPLPAPVVALNSRVIVQRHINALALAYFLKECGLGSGQDVSKLTCGWFFTPMDQTAPVQRLIDDCRRDQFKYPNLAEGVQHLVKATPYEGTDAVRLAHRVAEALEDVKTRWGSEWEALCRQEDATRGQGENPAHKAVLIQKQRMEGEYLLRELADQGFLPAYGFPTHIAAFDNLTAQQARQIRLTQGQSVGREDNRHRRRELANRDSVMALREYAPGAQVVMDGLVYRSAGITLNWKVPATESEAKETQAIKFAWRCQKCGASGSSRVLAEAQHCANGDCGAEIKGANIRQFLEPAGFAVDFYEDPNNDVSTQDFIPVESPWVSANGEWLPLPNPGLGRFRVTTRGYVFHQSKGVHDKGYAICLECGRAEPMDGEGGKPQRFEKPHFKLRGDKKDRENGKHREICPGSHNDWAIKTDITLGAEGYTDVLEIQLANEAGAWLNDKTTALSLAVALRDALAELLGVRADELSCDAKEAREEGEGKRLSMLIFDRFAAGYASSADRFVDRLFHKARERLSCRSECDSACPHCILDFDQRFAAESLDRHRALELLTEEWLHALKLPSELAFFGGSSRPEYAEIGAALLRDARLPGLERIRLFGGGNGADLAPSPLRQLAYRLAGADYRVEVFIDSVDELEEGDRYLLASLADHPGIRVASVASLPREENGWIAAEVLAGGSAVRWGVADSTTLVANVGWGRARPLILATGLRPFSLQATPMTAQQLRPELLEESDREISIHHELDGSLQQFGERFWTLMAERHPPTERIFSDTSIAVTAIRYHDRYLFTPLSVALLINLIERVRSIFDKGSWNNPLITVTTTQERTPGERRLPRYVWSEWPEMEQRDCAIVNGFDYIDMKSEVISKDKRDTQHGRVLEITLSNGSTLQIRFDQGVSYWRARSLGAYDGTAIKFDFAADETDQAEVVAKMDCMVEGGAQSTQLFVRMQRS